MSSLESWIVEERDSEQQGFQSFNFRIWALTLALEKCSAGVDPAQHIFQTTRSLAKQKIQPAPSPPLQEVEARLRRGWSHLLSLYRDAEAPDFYAEINAWTPAKAWYALHHCFTSLIPFISPAAKRLDHELTTSESVKLVAQMRTFPHPFSQWTVGAPPAIKYCGFTRPPQPISNLLDPRKTSFESEMALLLRSTAEYRIDLKRRKWLRDNPHRKRLSPGKRNEWSRELKETTILHFMYRLRLRVNYEEADTFVLGAPSDRLAQRFARNLLTLTNALMAGVEGILVAHVDEAEVLRMVTDYATKRKCDATDPIGRRLKYLA